jgi:hypothetical protein
MYSNDIRNELISRIATFQVEYDLLLVHAKNNCSKGIKEKMIDTQKLIIFYQKELSKI